MRTFTVALLTVLIAGAYIWHHADVAATARVEYLAEPISDDTVTVGFSAGGLLNRDVRIVAFNL